MDEDKFVMKTIDNYDKKIELLKNTKVTDAMKENLELYKISNKLTGFLFGMGKNTYEFSNDFLEIMEIYASKNHELFIYKLEVLISKIKGFWGSIGHEKVFDFVYEVIIRKLEDILKKEKIQEVSRENLSKNENEN